MAQALTLGVAAVLPLPDLARLLVLAVDVVAAELESAWFQTLGCLMLTS